MIKYHLPSLSGIEVYDKCLKEPMEFDVFLSLWSCYDGIPGLYELAYNSNAFTNRSINISSVFNILLSFIPLHNTEQEWIQKSSGKGHIIQNITELKDPVLIRLKDIGVLTQQNTIYVRDKVVQSFSIASKLDMMENERLNNIRGYGLECLARSIAPEIFKYLKIGDPLSFVEVARGYGDYDIDAVYSNRSSSHYILFSCKVNPFLHKVEFLDNIEAHFMNQRPPNITLILCSPSEIPKSFIEERIKNNFNWDPYFAIECVDLSQIIPPLSHRVPFLQQTGRWPFLSRDTEKNNFLNLNHRIVHVIGHRRVGKTHLIRNSFPNAIYVDFKLID